MTQSGYLSFAYANCGVCKNLKAKTLKGMFAEANRIIQKKSDIKDIQKITLHYGVYLTPVPSYSGDCNFMDFVLFDRKEAEERGLV